MLNGPAENGKQLLDSEMLKKNFDWVVLETHVRKEIMEILIPFRQEMLGTRVNNTEQADRYVELCDRMIMCEDYCRIENKKFRRPHFPPPPVKVTTAKNRVKDPILKQNKFEELEDLITTNNQEHREEIQKFLDKIEGFQDQFT